MVFRKIGETEDVIPSSWNDILEIGPCEFYNKYIESMKSSEGIATTLDEIFRTIEPYRSHREKCDVCTSWGK
jgi:hypothetical protein